MELFKSKFIIIINSLYEFIQPQSKPQGRSELGVVNLTLSPWVRIVLMTGIQNSDETDHESPTLTQHPPRQNYFILTFPPILSYS